MKKCFIFPALLLLTAEVIAQPGNKYPEPEFINEVYYLKKDSINTVIRLEKSSSKMESKMKLAGFGGAESGYSIEGEKSSIRINAGANPSFVYSTSTSSGSAVSTSKRDSMMRANGMDPSLMQGMGGMDPMSMISLYKMESGKKQRKILIQKSGGAMPFSSHKNRSSDKYTFSVKKIREGYWELVVDKPLSKGEYAFSVMDMSSMNAAGTLLFAFAID